MTVIDIVQNIILSTALHNWVCVPIIQFDFLTNRLSKHRITNDPLCIGSPLESMR